MITTSDIASITGGILSGASDIVINDLIIDSRKSSLLSQNTLFIAIEGDRNDGHSFILQLYRSGVRAFLTEKALPEDEIGLLKDAAIIRTNSSLAALHAVAKHVRESYSGAVIAITGSNGKTIVKEWLSDVLGIFDLTVRSPRSYNSQTGVPLSLWRLKESSIYAVIEAGMSMPGEISRLEKIIRPDIGVITNIGEAHQENFEDLTEKVIEKVSLFKRCKTIIYCKDHQLIADTIENCDDLSGKRLFSWSSSEEYSSADVKVIKRESNSEGTLLNIIVGKRSFTCRIPFVDRASVENISTVVTVAASLNLDLDKILPSLKRLDSVAMRMEKRIGINRSVLICDYYNSDPGSLDIALDHLKILPYTNKTLIVSDFIQSGRELSDLCSEVLTLSKRAGVNRFICIGEGLIKARDMFPADTLFFAGTDEVVDWFRPSYFLNEAILLKGARVFEFEKIAALLEHQVHTTRLEINLNSVIENLNYYRSKLKKSTMVMAMIKAFAYGAGPRDIAEWLNYNGIEFLAVAYTDEGIDLRLAGVTNRIMVMSPDPTSFRTMIEYDLEPELFSLGLIKSFIIEAEKNGLVDYPVHIKLDTGMYRLGLAEEELPEAISLLDRNSNIRIASVFSHLGSAENSRHDEFTYLQAERFERMSMLIEEATGEKFIRHLLNSSGVERFPQFQYDMVRLGIGLYHPGIEGSGSKISAATFKTTVTQIKVVKPGDGVGYGFTDSSESERVIAIVPVGYADGLSRSMGEGKSRMYVNGAFVKVVGRVCMDMCMIDITGTEVNPGDEVEIFGEHISIDEVAAACETIPHEILTGIPPRVKRVFYYD